MTSENHHRQDGPLSNSERQLEEILQDPNANWSDIRNAMKARGQSACTNAALMRAIASGAGPVKTALPARDASPSISPPVGAKSVVSTVDVTSTELDESEPKSTESGDEEYDEYVVTTFSLASAEKRPSRRARRRSLKASKKFMIQSVNMMDFGVDHFAEICDEEESIGTVESNYSCDSKGFIGWDHDDDETSVKSDLSRLCDADGFLSWDLTASAKAARSVAAKTAASLKSSATSGATNWSKECDSDGFLPWEVSASARAANSLEAERIAKQVLGSDAENTGDQATGLWRIEDYEGSSEDDKIDTSGHFMNPMNIFTSMGKRMSQEKVSDSFWKNRAATTNFKAPETDADSKKDCLELNDVKQALMNCSLRKNDVENTKRQPPDIKAKPNPLKHLHKLHSISSAHPGAEHSNNTNCDTREAIWIKREEGDGGVDIEKECRKLYSEVDDRQEKRGSTISKFIRRASLIG